MINIHGEIGLGEPFSFIRTQSHKNSLNFDFFKLHTLFPLGKCNHEGEVKTEKCYQLVSLKRGTFGDSPSSGTSDVIKAHASDHSNFFCCCCSKTVFEV